MSQSEAEYETCDSGVSEPSSLSDETLTIHRRSIPIPQNQQYQAQQQQSLSFSRSPSPASIQRSLKSNASNATRNTRSNSVTSLNSLSASAAPKPKEDNPPNNKPPHRSIISDVFDGKLLSSVQCLTCDRVSTREETFQDLSLPIPGKDHLNVLHQSQGILAPSLSHSGTISPDPVGHTPSALFLMPINNVWFVRQSYQAAQDGWFWWFWNWFRSFFWGPAVTLHDCMSAFFSADELKGDNMYRYVMHSYFELDESR